MCEGAESVCPGFRIKLGWREGPLERLEFVVGVCVANQTVIEKQHGPANDWEMLEENGVAALLGGVRSTAVYSHCWKGLVMDGSECVCMLAELASVPMCHEL